MKVRWVLIGEVVAAHGSKGEVRAIPQTEFPDRFLGMDHVLLFRKADSEPCLQIKIEECRLHKGFVLLKLQGIDTIEQAETLKECGSKWITAM